MAKQCMIAVIFIQQILFYIYRRMPGVKLSAVKWKDQEDETWWAGIRNWLLILLGIGSATFGLKAFLLPHRLVDGGVMGMSMLSAALTPLPVSLLIVLLNLPFIFLSATLVNRPFAMRSVVAAILLALAISLAEFPSFTKDIWLVTVFGGFFVGGGIGLVIRGGASIDGTEILALYLSRRSSLSLGDVHILLNVLFFGLVAWFIGLETALYSILTYFTTARTTDFLTEGVEEYIGVTIVTQKHEEMIQMIIDQLGRGVTIYDGKLGHGKRGQIIQKTDILYTVITRLELYRLQEQVERVDPDAFVVYNNVRDTRGGKIKKRPLKRR
ncbi:MAG: YitT family protein [Bacteroidetes bacterium]|nr:YitT family protein [Bacteroidota bacterium]